MSEFSFKGNDFYLDGEKFVVISGAMHYFRIPKEYWHDRLLKLKECGFNTVETYVCWNLHEPVMDGEFCFDGMLDIVSYIETAKALGLYVILRPGPFICAEWEFGGFPGWLRNVPGIQLRCFNAPYLGRVKRYLTELFSRVSPYFIGNGGNIIMVQLENEYGSYGDDKEYLNALLDMYKELGVNALIYTADGTNTFMLGGGTVEGVPAVANFGSRVHQNFENLRAFRPGQPTMCGEFWVGWFDHWYEQHHVRGAEEVASLFREMMDEGASVNFYMFHGGTNFGFTNGANCDAKYQPTVTSYDYCSPLSEAGDRTDTYYAVRDLINKYHGPVPPLTAKESKKAAYGKLKISEWARLSDNLDELGYKKSAAVPLLMEEMGQNFGYILYTTYLKAPTESLPIIVSEVHDRAIVYIDGVRSGVIERATGRRDEMSISLDKGQEKRIDILLENQGRINFGPEIPNDFKGIKGVRIGQRYHYGWDTHSLPMDDISKVRYSEYRGETESGPVFLKFILDIDGDPADTFIDPTDFGKGFITVNGVNIGRYFNEAGPQKTLYIPAPFLKNGRNEIVLFETEGVSGGFIELKDVPVLG